MKKLILISAIVILVGTSCQEKIDIEKEKAAIIAVIEDESEAFDNRDFDRLAACFVQDESTIRLGANKSNYFFFVGWEKISSMYMDSFVKNPEPRTAKVIRTYHKIKVHKEFAWSAHENKVISINDEGEPVESNTVEVIFFEKVESEWKIVYLSTTRISSWEVEIEEEE